MLPDALDRAGGVLDMEDLLTRCLGNVEFAERILAMFRERFGADLAELEKTAAAGDSLAVARLAHRLKGASANAAAPGLRSAAARVEQAARQGSLAEVPARLGELRREWRRFTESLSLLEAAV